MGSTKYLARRIQGNVTSYFNLRLRKQYAYSDENGKSVQSIVISGINCGIIHSTHRQRQRRVGFSDRFTSQIEPTGVVDETIEKVVAQGGFFEEACPSSTGT